MKKLNLEFYSQDALTVAKELLGKLLVRVIDGREIICKIVETEAYIGPEDKACHAYNNKRTNRTEIMFKHGGYSYVYLIYGMYNCLNIITNKAKKPEGVLIRAIEPINGLEIIKKNRNIKSKKIQDLTNGPGKLCKALLIDRKLNGYDVINGEELFIIENEKKSEGKKTENFEILKSKRINIDYSEEYKDKLWRFYIKDNKFVSKI